MMGTYEYAFVKLEENPYKEDAAVALGSMLDLCVNVSGCDGEEVLETFLASGLARQFELQNPVYVSGKSGVELADLMLSGLGGPALDTVPDRFERTPEYWVGWVLALYQVERGLPYARVIRQVSFQELRELYYPLHEAPESKFFEQLDSMLADRKKSTRLKEQREIAGLSQSELACAAGVGIRSIQMYEQGNKDINKAQAMTLYRLSRALNCDIEDLLEF